MSDADHAPRNFELRNHRRLPADFHLPVHFHNVNATPAEIESAVAAIKSAVPQAFIGRLCHVLAVEYHATFNGLFDMTITLRQVVA